MILIIRFILLVSVAYSSESLSFGSSSLKGSHEHAFITTAALSCDSNFETSSLPTPCFERDTMTNLGIGHPGLDWLGNINISFNYKGEYSQGFSAVEAPDNLVIHWSGGPDWWHCDNSDYFESPNYPRTRQKSTEKLLDCRIWAQRMLGDGFSDNSAWCPVISGRGSLTYSCEGVAAVAKEMLDSSGKIAVEQPVARSDTRGCDFNGARGRIKCLVLQQFGYALHAVQDFYSHSNYADLNPVVPYSFSNPPGLGRTDLPALWSLVNPATPSQLLPDPNLSVGCYPNSCANSGRTSHAVLNKDLARIDSYTGTTSKIDSSNNPRAAITVDGITNSQRAVNMAIRQTRQAWLDLQALIIKKEGSERGNKIICAIASDNPNQCGLSKSEVMRMMPQGKYEEPRREIPFSWVSITPAAKNRTFIMRHRQLVWL